MRQVKGLNEDVILKAIRFAVVLVSLGMFTAAIGQTISIDLGTDLGPVKHVSSGFLFGISKDGLNPSTTLTKPLKLTSGRISTMEATKRLLAEGVPIGMIQVLVQDNFGWRRDASMNNYADWENSIVNKVNTWKNQNLHPQYDIVNEPDSPTFWKYGWDTYLEAWRRAYLKIRQTDPQALICGGSFSYLNPTGKDVSARFRAWLEYCKANNVVPDYITWHFPDDYVGEVAECRRLISTMGLTSVRGIIINENVDATGINGILSCEYTGTLIYDICQTERSGADGAMHACWRGCVDGDCCYNGSLDGILVSGKPTGKYYVYERYARISGRILKTVPYNKMELFAAKDSASGIASAIFGGPVNHSTLYLKIKGFSKTPYLANGGKVHVTIEKIKATGPQEECTPSMIVTEIDNDYPIKGDSLVIPYNYGGHNFACYLKLSAANGSSPAPNLLPTCNIYPPSNTATFYAPANISVSVTADDPDGKVTRVDLYKNDVLVGTDLSAPYQWNVVGLTPVPALQNLPIGTYTLKAVATDDSGATKSHIIAIDVKASAISGIKIKQNNIDVSGQGESNVQIINLRGQVVRSEKVFGNRQLSLDGLAPGVYQVRTKTERGITCEKMVR